MYHNSPVKKTGFEADISDCENITHRTANDRRFWTKISSQFPAAVFACEIVSVPKLPDRILQRITNTGTRHLSNIPNLVQTTTTSTNHDQISPQIIRY
jgi:hypothetical protein